jgi:precorrin-6B methylase 2
MLSRRRIAFDRHKPRPMTKEQFRAAVMRDLGIEGDTHD